MSSIVTAEMMSGVFKSVLDLVPVVLPAVVGFVGFRKGWSFLLSAIRGA